MSEWINGMSVDEASGVMAKSPWGTQETSGNYATEKEASDDFIRHVNDDHWEVLHEVRGEVIHPKIGCDKTSVSADFILWPKLSLINNGWDAGPICVEIKKSGVKLGPVINQALDYMRCLFTSRIGNEPTVQYAGQRGLRFAGDDKVVEFIPPHVDFKPRFCVIFPVPSVLGEAQSVMANNRIGWANIRTDGRLGIYLDGKCVYTETGGVFLRSALKSGKKFGSR